MDAPTVPEGTLYTHMTARIIVLGYLIRGPLGGIVWHHLQYVAGLRKLGHDVYFIEDSDNYPSCYDPSQQAMTTDPSFGLRSTADLFAKFGLEERWAYYDEHTGSWLGPCASSAVDLFRTADLLLDISGVNPIRSWTLYPTHRALIDTDPVFTQVRLLCSPEKMEAAAMHSSFFTFAENIGKPDCLIPGEGFQWMPTRQPVVLDAWQVTPGHPDGNFTTVMHWDSYRPVEYGGKAFGMKSASFGPYIDLPERVQSRLELAVGGPGAPRDTLSSHGWIVRNPLEIIPDPSSYQTYIRQSKAEFTVAKHGYAISRSGWFSERSAAYLASGRPVITQDTGFGDWIDTDSGLLSFDSPESAADAIARVDCDYAAHCRRARAIAEEVFDSNAVLTSLIERATQIPATSPRPEHSGVCGSNA